MTTGIGVTGVVWEMRDMGDNRDDGSDRCGVGEMRDMVDSRDDGSDGGDEGHG